ncbi:hypothetical protein P3T76_004394 [Phytophthora citrophthora]|uniref:Uncharacterized protein n=1 Tax=Phytophthora citrophthora TaxID=4793 RepID=A0AAD9LRB4_9STRA|nr:hypothetical protein P3T76_004394 [Phytophthora citrophthora]
MIPRRRHDCPMSSIPSSDGVVMVPWWAFMLWWFVFLAVHVATSGYNMAYAFFYWWLNDTTIRVYLVFYHVGMSPTYYGIIAIVHLVMSIIHGLGVVLMIGSSLWLRRLVFTPWGAQNNPKESNGMIKVIQVQSAGRQTSRVSSAVLTGVSKLTTHITNRYGLLGVNGPYFHVISLTRELIETTLQTIQAYRMSRLLPSMLLNRFYVVGLVLNCWSPVIVFLLFYRQDEMRKRFASLASDCALDILSCMGVTLIVVLSYIGQYDPAAKDFGVNPWYNDEWSATAVNEFQMVLVVSWSDLASRVIFSIGLLMTTTNMKELLCPIPRLGNRVVHFADSTVDKRRAIRLKSIVSKPPSARLLSKIPRIRQSETWRSKTYSRIRKVAMRIIHFLFFVWGLVVLVLHIQASVQPSLQQCSLQVRPWAVSRPYCFLVSLDCYRLGISGHLEEVDLKWREFDGSTVVMMVIKHCPQLDVPDTFNEFHQLISIKVYNTTILEWRESTAITNTNHPNFLSLMLVRVNMTDGHLPAGFQSTEMPLNLYDFEFCVTNLKELPDDLDLKWFPGSYIIIEYSQFQEVPATLLRLAPPYFSLSGNPISELPPEIFEVEGLTDLGIGDINISELPYNVTQLSTTLSTIYAEGTRISSFWAWTDAFLGRPSIRDVPRSIYAGNTIYCDDLEKIKDGSASTFGIELSPEFSSQLMDPTKATLDGEIWSWVDCNPPISGFSGPLYPRRHDYPMSTILSSDGVVMVPWWAFMLWWFVFLAVHVATSGYNMAYAFFYWWLNDTTIRVYLVFYHVGMPPTYYGIIAVVHLVMSIIHGLGVVLMIGSSLWLRRLVFTPWGAQNNPKESNGMIKVIQVQSAGRQTSRVSSAVLTGVSKLTTHITNRYGLLGVNGPYFHVISLTRELIETTLQTIQAYRMSRLLPSMLLNRFYVVGLVLNCWSPVIVFLLFYRQDEMRKRFASLASDCALDILSCMGVTLIVVLSYIGQYDPAAKDFGVNPWYNDEWSATAVNEFQMVLVVSWSDLASRVIFSIGLLMTTTNMKELLCPIPRLGNRVVHFADSTVDKRRAIRLKSIVSKPPSARLLSKIPRIRQSETWRSKTYSRIRKVAMRIIHFLFFVWGLVVLVLHIQASVQPSLQQCSLQVRPWAVSRPYCFLVSLDCYRLGISGHLEEVDLKWREFDGSTVVMMVIKHCPQLDVPDTFNEFHQLISIKVYNTTILEWRESTAITNTNHPNFLSLMLVRVNMTDGHLPAGFQSTEMPLNLYDFEFCVTNLKELPDDLDLKWFPGSYIIIEYSQFQEVPATLLRLAPPYFSLSGNPISELPPEIFEVEGLTDLGIGDINISELPYNVTQLSTTLSTIYAEGTRITSFWAWIDAFLGRPSYLGIPRSIYAADTIYCEDLEKIKDGSISVFSAKPSPDFSTQLMDPKKQL